jgi:hypothetical protein
MPVSSITGRLAPATRPAALICVVMAGAGLIASIALGWPSSDGQLSITAILPQLAALFALAAGMLSLFQASSPASASQAPPGESDTQQVSALQTMVWELRGVLAEEKVKLATFQEVCGATAHDANVMSARMARLAEASVEAEQRLVAATAAADKAIRQPAAVVTWAAEAAQRIERALPEFAEIIRTSIAAQSEVLAPALESAATRMVTDAGSAVHTFHASVADAAGTMQVLGAHVGAFNSALAQLPAAATAVTEAADKAAFTIAEASAALCADSASLGAHGRETVHAAGALREEAETLRATGQEIAGVERETITNVTSTIEAAAARLAAVIADADAARQGSVSMVELASRLEAAAASLADGTSNLDAAGQRIAAKAEGVSEGMDNAAGKVIAAAYQATETLSQASTALSENSAMLGAASRETEQVIVTLRQEAEALLGTGQTVAAAETQAIRHVADTTEAAATRLAEVIADADAARQGAVPMVVLTARLEQVAATLADRSGSLEETGKRIDASGAGVAECLDTAAATLAEANATISTGRSELDQAARETARTVTTLRATAQDLADTEKSVIAAVAESAEATAMRLAAVIADADAARHGSVAMTDLTSRLEQAAATMADRAATLTSVGERVAAVAGGSAGRIDAAAASVTAAADHAIASLTEASAVLCADSASLDASGQETLQAASAVRQEAEILRTAAQDHLEAQRQDLASAVTHVSSMLSETASQAAAKLSDLAARLEINADSLEAVRKHLADTGETVSGRLSATVCQLDALPGVAAEISAALSGLQVETSVLAAVGQQIADAGAASTQAVNEIAARVEVSGASLDTAGRLIGSTADDMAAQIDRLTAVTDRASAQAERLPDAAARIVETTDRLHLWAETLPIDTGLAAFPEIAARLEATSPRLDQLDALSIRLEHAIAGLPAQDAQSVLVATVSNLSADIAAAVSRVETALSDHDKAGDSPLLAAQMQDTVARLEATAPRLDQLDAISVRLEQAIAGLPAGDAQTVLVATISNLSADIATAINRVETALTDHDKAGAALLETVARVQAAATQAAQAAEPDPLPEGVPVVLAATLRDLDGMASQSETLLKQTEALAEAVLKGLAPTLPSLLGDRTPAILAGVETTIKRLSSVATALALASDGQPLAAPAIRRSA